MSDLYGTSHIESMEELAKSDTIMELFMIDDVLKGSSEDIKNFCESTEGQIVMEKQAFSKKVLSKEEQMKRDYNRRVKILAYTMCKQYQPQLFVKLTKALAMKKKYVNQIMQRYGTKAAKMAKISQKEYMKKVRSIKDTPSEEK